jgi:hypothetical protein
VKQREEGEFNAEDGRPTSFRKSQRVSGNTQKLIDLAEVEHDSWVGLDDGAGKIESVHRHMMRSGSAYQHDYGYHDQVVIRKQPAACFEPYYQSHESYADCKRNP